MGLSLKNIGKKIEDVFGGAVHAVTNEVQQAPHQISQVANSAAQVARPVLSGAVKAANYTPAGIPLDLSKAVFHTPDLSDITKATVRAIPQAGVRAGLALTHQKQFTPTTPAEKLLVGNDPVKNFEGYGRDTADLVGQGKRIPKPLATGLGVGLSALDVLPMAGEAKPAVKAVAEDAKAGFPALINETGSIRKPRAVLKKTAIEKTPQPEQLPIQQTSLEPKPHAVAKSVPSSQASKSPDKLAKALGLDYTPTKNYSEPVTLYRGSGDENSQIRDRGRGTSFSTSKDVAQKFVSNDDLGFSRNNGVLGQYKLSPKAKVWVMAEHPEFKRFKGDIEATIEYARKHGYDAIDMKGRVNPALGYAEEHEYRVLNPKAVERINGLKQLGSVQQHTTAASLEKSAKNTENLINRSGLSPQSEKATAAAIAREKSAQSNPVKVNIPEVAPGDFAKARSNTQLASNPIKVMTQHATAGIKQLSANDRDRFWRDYVENPKTIATAENPAAVTEAVSRWRQLANTTHATDRALGGQTGYLDNYARGHNWDLSNPDDAAKFNELVKISGGREMAPEDFKGINNLPRVFNTINEGEAAGFKLKPSDPIKDIQDFGNSSASALRRQALIKGVTEADAANPQKLRSLDLGNGSVLPLSKDAIKEVRAFEPSTTSKKVIPKVARTVNQGLKSTLLSAGQFHSINISALRAAPTLALEGHPLSAAKGVYRTFRAAFGEQYADQVMGKAIKDGTVEKAARIGMPYGVAGYNTEGTFLKNGVGQHTVFEKQIPMMHDQVARSVISDLEKKGISLDSPQARQAGLVGSELMGELNKDVMNISPKVRQAMTDWMLAGQFTPSKFLLLKDAATKGGVAGSYARRAIIGNVAAVTAIAAGLGYLGSQQSDDIRDIFLRALIDPAVPTNQKDEKGNTVKLRLPGTDSSDIAKLLGIKLVRGDNGHLGIDWRPSNMPSTVEDFLRARLSPLASSAVKVATNSNYAGKPLYDPNASLGTKVAQAATTLGTGSLPIGLQGVAYTDAVKNNVPESVKEVLDANTPGTNPIVKSLGSSFGLTPSTDQTVGKGLDTSKYFDALGVAKQGLNRQEKDALDLYTGGKKNPVTGKYDIQPDVNDSRAKATALLQNPKVIDKLIEVNKTTGSSDPLWQSSKDQITKVLQLQAMPPQGPDQTDWHNKNDSWYKPLSDARSAFFQSLPAGDPNKPQAPIQYPEASPDVKKLQDQFFAITDSKQRSQFISAHPQLQDQFDKTDDYYNHLRTALGYAPQKGYPKATPQLQKFIDQYMGADKTTRKGLRTANSQAYKDMAAYFDSVDLYNVGDQAGVSQLKGEPDYTSKEAKSISGLAQDIYQNPDGSYSIVPAGWMNGLGSSSSGGSKSSRSFNTRQYALSINAGGKTAKPTVTVRGKGVAKAKGKSKASAPKVSIRKSSV